MDPTENISKSELFQSGHGLRPNLHMVKLLNSPYFSHIQSLTAVLHVNIIILNYQNEMKIHS